jgi:catechol 2,3-dioxygenase-like lactoylglutathione lyase family enzyme
LWLLDHIGIGVSSYAVSRAFYAAALAPLGYRPAMEFEGWAGFGISGPDDSMHALPFWIHQATAPVVPVHVAFRAENRASVRAFYDAALAAGGGDNGGPGLRPDYHPNYYAAFVLDPDGHNIEAVCHAAE